MREFVRTRVALVFLICFVVGTAFRLALLAVDLPVISQPGYLENVNDRADDKQYHTLAVNLLRYHVFSEVVDDPSKLDALRTPGYPALVALIYSVAGPRPAAVAGVQCVIGGLTCACLYLMARRHMAPLVAAIVALAFGLEPYAAVASLTLMTETFTAALLLLACWSLFAALERRSSSLALLAGVTMGIECITRPSFMLVAALFAAFVLVTVVRQEHPAARARHAGLIVVPFCLGCVAPTAAWCYRNEAVFGHFELSSQSGHWIEGHLAVPVVCEIEGVPWDNVSPVPDVVARNVPNYGGTEGEGVSQFEVSHQRTAWGVGVIRKHPLLFLKLSAKGWLDVLLSPNVGAYRRQLPPGTITGLLWIPSALLWYCACCLAVAGVLLWHLVFGHARVTAVLVLLTVAATLAPMGPGGVGVARYRIPLEPLIYLLAGIGLDALLRRRAAKLLPEASKAMPAAS